MSNTIITVDSLSKKYIIGENIHGRGSRTFRDIFDYKVKRFFSKKERELIKEETTIWALRNVNFKIEEGNVVGVIGRNGAGKSTLLKILSRITEPTSGIIKLKGRVASLLEVGTGFNQELTGRENVYLNGSILGMPKSEIDKKFDEIVAFAEIEKFLDTPVKRYSSGMYVRLAFAVAAHLEPDILIVDEVLAVGDAQFQKKCLGKMSDVSVKEGRTVLFVSHNMDAILRLCPKTIVLKEGMMEFYGVSSEAVGIYLNTNLGTIARRVWEEKSAPGNHVVRLKEVRCHTEDGTVTEVFDITKPIGITMDYIVLKEGYKFTHSINLFNEQGIHILSSHDNTSQIRNLPRQKGHYSTTIWIPGNLLAEGQVTVSAAILEQSPLTIYFHELNAIGFNVIDKMSGNSARGSNYTGFFPGVIRPILKWDTIILNNN